MGVIGELMSTLTDSFAYSKEQCIRAARASLRMMGSDNASAAFIEKWW